MALPAWFQYPGNTPFADRSAAVIGGGLAGASVAVALAGRGWQVTLIERNPVLSDEASGNRSGVVMPAISRDFNPASQFSLTAFGYALQHFRQLEGHSKSPFFHSVGVVQTGKNTSRLRDAVDRHFTELQASTPEPDQLAEQTGLQSGVAALLFPTAGWASPVGLCRAQIESRRTHIEIICSQQVTRLQRRPDGWLLLDGNRELIETPVVVVANGTDTRSFAQTAPISTTPVRGQVSFVSARALKSPLQKVICSDRGYVIPDRRGSFSVGATYERDSSADRVTESSHRENLRNLNSLNIVDNADTSIVVGGRAAVRTATLDHMPIIGAVPEFSSYRKRYQDLHHGRPAKNYPPPDYHPGLFIAAGFGSRGITHCPYSGDLLARLIDGGIRDEEWRTLGLLHPGRFVIRGLRKNRWKNAI